MLGQRSSHGAPRKISVTRPSQPTDRRNELRAELARKVALFVGRTESRPTDVPGLTLYRHTAPTMPAPVTYEPSVALVVQGRKQVELGPNTFLYDPWRYLLTSLDLPVVNQVVEGSPETPYLCLRLKLEMSSVRELLNREDFPLSLADRRFPCDDHSGDECRVAWCIRTLTRSVERPAGHSVSEPDDSTGDCLPHSERCWRATAARHRHLWGPELPHCEGHRLDPGELYEDATNGGSRAHCRNEHLHAASPLPSSDFHEPAAVSKTTSFAGGSGTHADGRCGCRHCGVFRGIRKRKPV